jgi:hypothetical protein
MIAPFSNFIDLEFNLKTMKRRSSQPWKNRTTKMHTKAKFLSSETDLAISTTKLVAVQQDLH